MPKVLTPQLRLIDRGSTLYLRCTFNGQKAEVNTGLPVQGFYKKKQMYKGNRPLNMMLDDILSKCEEKINDGEIDVKKIIQYNVTQNKNTFTYIIKEYINENDLTFNTTNSWKALKCHLISCFGDDKSKFKDSEFVKYFVEKGFSDSTVYLYLGKCNALGFVINPRFFKKFKVAKRDYYLNREQLVTIRNYAKKQINRGYIYDGLLFFSILTMTGLSPIDLAMMKRTQISFHTIEKNYVKRKYIQIVGNRNKTGVAFKIILEYRGFALKFFDYAMSLNEGGKYLLPLMEDIDGDDIKQKHRLSNWLRTRTAKVRKIINEEINKNITTANQFSANKVELIDSKKFTFYTARHSVAMMLLLNNVSPAQISMFLGRSISNLSSYFHELEALQMVDVYKSIV